MSVAMSSTSATSTTANILIVEDDVRLAQMLEAELAQQGYNPTLSHSGSEALAAAAVTPFDLVILDLNLPDIDGIEIAERLRRDTEASILILSARGDVSHRVAGLYAGASDYLTKPFSVHELLARIHVRLRERQQEEDVIRVGGLVLDTHRKACLVGGEMLELTAQEFRVLSLLLQNRGRIFSKDDLEQRLYGGKEPPGSNTIEVFVYQLRKKLAAAGVRDLIRTVRGMGYVIR
ncbi:MAG: response regulator transcription factor [Trueperaceae bacterium]|nr:response regulator transcription factor [Trueperaceae bacterium]